jgi:hypothetical protein
VKKTRYASALALLTIGTLCFPAIPAEASSGYFTLNFATGDSEVFSCNAESMNGFENITGAENECTVRVWLHEDNNGGGYALCIRQNSTAVIKKPYRQFQVTTNKTTCPS